MERNIDLLGQPLGQSAELGAASGEEDAVFDDVGVELRRGLLEDVEDRGFDTGDRFVEAVGDFLIGDRDLDRVGGHDIRTADDEGFRLLAVKVGDDGADGDFDLFGGRFARLDVVLLAEVGLDVGGEDVAGDADGVLLDDAAEGDDGDFRRAATDIDDHVAARGFYVETDSEGCGHRFINQVDVASSGVFGGVADGADLDFGRSGRDAYDDLQVRREEALMLAVDFADKTADHHFSGLEVCDDAVPQRADSLDAGIGPFVHQLGLLSDCDAFVRMVVNGYDRRLVQGDLVVLEDDGIGRPEVHCQLLRKKVECHILRVKGLF